MQLVENPLVMFKNNTSFEVVIGDMCYKHLKSVLRS